MKTLHTVAHLSPWVTGLVFVVLLASAVLFLKFGPASDLKKIRHRLPECPRLHGYDVAELARYLDALRDRKSLSLYRRQLHYDVGFALFYGACSFLVLAGTFGRILPSRLSALHWLAFIPVLGATMDVFEDLALLRSVDDYSNGSLRADLVAAASVCTRVKWLLLLMSAIVFLIGVCLLVIEAL